MHRYPLVAFVLAASLTVGLAQTFTEDFETGPGGAASYHKAPDDVKVERLQGGAASGQWYLRGALPSKQKLEGYSLNATGLTGGRLATVTASVRGQGEVWLCLISGNGWLYSPATKTLTDQWQEVSLSKVLIATDKSLGIYFISRDVQPGAVFAVDHVRVTTTPPAETWDAPVGPWRLEAEDFAMAGKTVAADAQARGGKTVQSEQYVSLEGLPAPRTSKPISVFCHVRSGEAGDTWRLVTRQGGETQYLRSAQPTQTTGWEWLKLEGVAAGELGDSFGVCCTRGPNARGWISLDSVVVATDSSLTPEQLAAAPELFGSRPLALVGRGQADARPGVNLGGFITVGGRTAPQAPTEARVAYDDAALSLRFDCPEPLLDTAMQRRHEFLAKVTQRDGDVWADDCVAVLLQPAGSPRVYEFVVNALGTLEDAADAEPDLWDTRDVKWNSQATTRAGVEEKRWWAELRIPWSDLGGKPKAGARWAASFARSARGRKEQSAWNLTDKGIHDPIALGTLVFADTVPQLSLQPPAALKAKGNALPPPTAEAGARASAFAEVRSGGGVTRHYGPAFDVPSDPDLQTAYGVLDAATLQPLVLTPLLPQGVKSSFADLTIACDGPYELFLNGQPVASGAATDGAKAQVALEKGVNALALRVPQGTAALGCQIGEWRGDASGWKMAPADTKEAVAAATDEGAWATAPTVGQHPQLGPIVGAKGKALVLRQTLLFEKTRVWPTPDPVYSLAQGVTQHLTFRTEGLKGRKLDQWETFLAVPPGFEVLGSTGFYASNRTGIPTWKTTQLGEQTVLGKKMRVAKISADQPILPGRHYIMSEFEAFVRWVGNGQSAGPAAHDAAPADSAFLYWSQANVGSVIEAPQTIKVRLLPEVRGAQCKTLVWQLWGGWLSNMDDLGMREQILACAQKAGFNDIVSGDRWTSDNAPRHGLKHTHSVCFQSWSLNLGPYLKDHPDQRLVDTAGKTSDQYLCLTRLLGDGWGAVRAALAKQIDEVKPHTVDYDFEYGPFTSHHSCYCDRCLAAFREFAKLPADTKLDGDSIAKQHREQWVDFMARRVAKVFALFSRTVHELSPGTKFSVYSGYATPDNAERYGVDWRYVGEEKGCDHAGCGYGRPVADIAATIDALQGLPLVCGALVYPYERDALTPATPLTKAWLLRTVLDSTGGVLVYERTSLDGRSWLAMGETTRLVAKYEPVFLQGKRVPVGSLPSAQAEALQHGGTTLVCLMNPGAKAVSLKAALPKEWGGGEAFYSKRKVTAGTTVEVALEPGEAEAVVLR